MEGEPDTGTILYSLAKMVRVRVYQDAKEAKQAEEEKVREVRRVQRATNTLIKEYKRLEKEGKDAATQLAQELLAENLDTTPAPLKQMKSKAKKVKESTLTVSKLNLEPQAPKVLVQKNSKATKATLKSMVVEKEVIGESSRGRKIILLERFSKNK